MDLAGDLEAGDMVGWALAVCDFNADGKDDLAIGAPQEDVNYIDKAGVVNVNLGSASGPTSTARVYTQDTWGSNGAEANDFFGDSLAYGDFDGDGYDDLAIGAPQEDVNPIVNAGAVFTIYGSSSGLNTSRTQLLTQASWGSNGSEEDDYFGDALAVGDFDGDGFDDLAIGGPREDVNPIVNAGALFTIYGSQSSGLTTSRVQLFTQASWGSNGSEAGDLFGAALASGDFDGDGKDDLGIGGPGEDVNPITDAGALFTIYGSGTGLTTSRVQLLTQSNLGGAVEAGDQMGSALGACDFDGDTKDDLAVGAAGEAVGSASNAGAVNVIYGAAGGLNTSDIQQWYQSHQGMAETPEAGDILGSAIATCRW